MHPPRLRRDGPIPDPPRRGPAPTRRRRFPWWAVTAPALLLAAGALGACGEGGDSAPAGRADGPAATGGTTPATAPRRVVSLAPSHTELLFALGAGDRVVGVTRWCDRPAAALHLPRVADATTVHLEPLAALHPDLVVANAEALAEAVAPLRGRFRFLAVPTDSLDDLLAAPLALGEALGLPEEGRALRARMDEALAAADRRAAGRTPSRVLFVVQRDPFYVAGPGSFVDALLRRLGHANAAAGMRGPWPTPSAEAILAMAPEVLVDAAPAVVDGDATAGEVDAEVRAYWARYPGLPAVRAGRVRRLGDVAAVRPGPALAEALEALERALAPPADAPPRRGGMPR